MAKVFFSYSHRDEAVRDELEVHLAQLKREKLIESWHDRRIDAGDNFPKEIDENLQSSDIVLLLVSPYFLNSKYCVEVEMEYALRQHSLGVMRVIPVILDPCDWHSAPFGQLMAAPADGNPISKFPNKHDGYLEVAKAIRRIVEKSKPQIAREIPLKKPTLQQLESIAVPRSSNLRIKKEFSDREKDEFLDDAFLYISRFFEGSLTELTKRNPGIDFKVIRNGEQAFSVQLYKNGKDIGGCHIRVQSSIGKGITYSYGAAISPNGFNSLFTVKSDDQSIYLDGASFAGTREKMTKHGVAEYFWGMLMQPFQ